MGRDKARPFLRALSKPIIHTRGWMMGFGQAHEERARPLPILQKVQRQFVFLKPAPPPIVLGSLTKLTGCRYNPLKYRENPSLASFRKKRALLPASNCFVEISREFIIG